MNKKESFGTKLSLCRLKRNVPRAEVSVVRDVVKASDSEKDFLNKSLDHKVKILKYYDKVAWTVGPEVINVNVIMAIL